MSGDDERCLCPVTDVFSVKFMHKSHSLPKPVLTSTLFATEAVLCEIPFCSVISKSVAGELHEGK